MPARTVSSPLQRRDQLRTEGASARKAANEARAKTAEIEAAIKAAETERQHAYERGARGHAGEGDPVRVEKRLAELRTEFTKAKAAHGGASSAERKVQGELGRLYRDEFAAFAEFAEAKTQHALELFETLREPYAAAYAAWQEAVEDWREPCMAKNIGGAPACGLAFPGNVFDTAAVPRPAQVIPDQNESEDS